MICVKAPTLSTPMSLSSAQIIHAVMLCSNDRTCLPPRLGSVPHQQWTRMPQSVWPGNHRTNLHQEAVVVGGDKARHVVCPSLHARRHGSCTCTLA